MAWIQDNLKLEILPEDLDRNEWNKIVLSFGDHNFLQSWEWGEAKKTQEWKVIRFKVIRFICKSKEEIIGTGQGFIRTVPGLKWGVLWIPGGPLVLRDTEDISLNGNLSSVLNLLKEKFGDEKGLVVRCAPYLLSSQVKVDILRGLKFIKLPGPIFIHTFLIDIRDSMEVLRGKLRRKWRYTLKQFEKGNVIIREESSQKSISTFYETLKALEKTKGFHSGANLEQLESFFSLKSEDRAKLLLAYNDDVPIGGIIATCMGKRGFELFASATPEGYKQLVSYGLIWESIRWLKSIGAEIYDLGGVDAVNNKGVYDFKSGLRGDLVEFLGQWEYSPSKIKATGLHFLELLRK